MNDGSADDLWSRLARDSNGACSILDVGCGRGVHLRGTAGADVLRSVLDSGGTVTGIDVDLPDEAHELATSVREIGRDGSWPVADSSIDLAFSDWVLEHVREPRRYFSECARVLRPGGRLLVRTLQRWSIAGIGASVVPHRFHEPLIARLQPGMKLHDVFPTTLTANTRRVLHRLGADAGLPLVEWRTHPGLHGYAGGRPQLERVFCSIERRLPSTMHHACVVTFERT